MILIMMMKGSSESIFWNGMMMFIPKILLTRVRGKNIVASAWKIFIDLSKLWLYYVWSKSISASNFFLAKECKLLMLTVAAWILAILDFKCQKRNFVSSTVEWLFIIFLKNDRLHSFRLSNLMNMYSAKSSFCKKSFRSFLRDLMLFLESIKFVVLLWESHCKRCAQLSECPVHK